MNNKYNLKYNHTMEVINPMNNQLRPFSGRPTTGRPTTSKPNVEIEIESNSNSLKNITESEDIESSNSVSSKEKFEFLDSVVGGKQKENFENLIKEEADRIDMINKQKANLKNINLIEKNIEGLYDWKTLFNNSRPLSAYTQLNNQKAKKASIDNNNQFSFPVALIDAPPEEVELYIPNPNNYANTANVKNNKNRPIHFSTKQKKKNSKIAYAHSRKSSSNVFNRKFSSRSLNKDNQHNERQYGSNCTRPKSMYSQRLPGETFYLSQAFSEYYNEDLKTFSEKFPLLKAKIKVNPKKLQKALKDIKKQTIIRENNLKKVKLQDDLVLTKQEIIIAGMGGNAKPLLKSIYRQTHPDEHDDFDPRVKYYRNTDKPLGQDNGDTDYSVNDRTKHINEFIKLREEAKGNSRSYKNINEMRTAENFTRLHLDTYDEKDPHIQMFNQIQEENEVDIEANEESKVNDIVVSKKKEELTIKTENDNKVLTTLSQNQTEQTARNDNTVRTKYKIEATVSTNSNTQNNISNRPMTGMPKANLERPFSTLSNANLKNVISNRPMTTMPRQNNLLSDNNSTGFIPTKYLPLRTNSAVPNQTYRKIQNMIKTKKNNIMLTNLNTDGMFSSDIKRNAFSPSAISEANRFVRERPQTAFENKAIQNRLNELNNNMTQTQWSNNVITPKENKISYVYFNDYIDTTFNTGEKKRHDLEIPYFHPMNVFNKNAKYHYSSSNNYIVKKKRKDEMDFIHTNNYYTKKDMNIDTLKKKRIMSARVGN